MKNKSLKIKYKQSHYKYIKNKEKNIGIEIDLKAL